MYNVKGTMDGEIIQTSEAMQNLFFQYTHLPLGGKEIVCPYWMNNLEKGIYGPIGGKGKPGDIVKATVEEAKKENIDLNNLGEEEIKIFMRMIKIGVDCSGFVFWMLDEFDREKGGNGIIDDIPGSKGKFLVRASVKMLTGQDVSENVDSLNEIKVGDVIRTRRGKHIMIILSIKKRGQIVSEIEYVHSSGDSYTKTSGVHKGIIEIIDSNKSLKDQIWQETTPEGESYSKHFFPQEEDGIKRLKIYL